MHSLKFSQLEHMQNQTPSMPLFFFFRFSLGSLERGHLHDYIWVLDFFAQLCRVAIRSDQPAVRLARDRTEEVLIPAHRNLP